MKGERPDDRQNPKNYEEQLWASFLGAAGFAILLLTLLFVVACRQPGINFC